MHLEADLHRTVGWAEANGRPWAFSLSNAGAVYAQFRSRLDQLSDVNWPAVSATDFRSAEIKEGKQAEFLVYNSFPWDLVERIGVHSKVIARQATDALRSSDHRPKIEIRRDWYY